MHLDTLVNITDTQNQEIAMKINTDIENLNLEFFTDQNGFQVSNDKILGISKFVSYMKRHYWNLAIEIEFLIWVVRWFF